MVPDGTLTEFDVYGCMYFNNILKITFKDMLSGGIIFSMTEGSICRYVARGLLESLV